MIILLCVRRPSCVLCKKNKNKMPYLHRDVKNNNNYCTIATRHDTTHDTRHDTTHDTRHTTHDISRHDTTRHDTTRHDTTRHDTTTTS